MPIPIYSRVRITTDRFQSERAPKGTIGYVIEVYEDGAYEVEVMDSSGSTVALFVATDDDLIVAEEAEE
jgi:hypothetical protein